MTKARVSARLGAIAPSATLVVSNKARELKAAGHPVIGFGADEPDFTTPSYIVAAAVETCQNPVNYKCSATRGLPKLRQAIAAKTQCDSGYAVDPNTQILVTDGGKQAVFQVFAAIMGEGDEVLLPAPYWMIYPEVVAPVGGKTIEIFAGTDQDYKVTVEQLEAARTERTKALLVCSPSSPTGATYTPAELTAIGQWAVEHDVWVITDEIYEHLLYDGAEVAHVVKLVPGLADTCLVLSGVTKSYAMTGWHVGWMIDPADAIQTATNFQSHLTSNVCNIAQRAAVAAVGGSLDVVKQIRQTFDRRHRTIVSMLCETDGLSVPAPRGAFYVYPDVAGLFDQSLDRIRIESSSQLASLILGKVGVATVPGETFGPSGFLRFSYTLTDEDLKTGVTRVRELLARVKWPDFKVSRVVHEWPRAARESPVLYPNQKLVALVAGP